MMRNHHDNGMSEFAARTISLALAWLTSWTLGEVQQLVGIVSGLVLLGYTVAQWRALWRRERSNSDEDAGS